MLHMFYAYNKIMLITCVFGRGSGVDASQQVCVANDVNLVGNQLYSRSILRCIQILSFLKRVLYLLILTVNFNKDFGII